MEQDVSNTLKRKKDALKYANELLSIKEYGVQKHTMEWCLHKAGDKYYYSYNTMRMITYDSSIQKLVDDEMRKEGKLKTLFD